jgi:hypothetical protein
MKKIVEFACHVIPCPIESTDIAAFHRCDNVLSDRPISVQSTFRVKQTRLSSLGRFHGTVFLREAVL